LVFNFGTLSSESFNLTLPLYFSTVYYNLIIYTYDNIILLKYSPLFPPILGH